MSNVISITECILLVFFWCRGVALTWWKQRREHLLAIGYKVVGEKGMNALLLKAYAPDQRVWFLERQFPQLELIDGKIVVDVYWSLYFCKLRFAWLSKL